jgi:AcrR family transcriptional regulator
VTIVIIKYTHFYVKKGVILLNNQKTSPRKQKALETRKRIYESAERLFRQYGFDHVSVDLIVEQAGVAKGSFYVHFDSKNALIATLLFDNINKIDLGYRLKLESLPAGLSASNKLISFAKIIAETITDSIGYDVIKTIYEVYISRAVNVDALLAYNRDVYKFFGQIINQGKQQGEFKTELNTDCVMNHCIMAIRGLTYEWCIRYPDFDLKDQVLEHFDILLMGIKKQ